MRKQLHNMYNGLRNWITPGLRNSQFAYRDKLAECLRPETKWLDLGCGHNLLPSWMPNALQDERALVARCGRVVGIDADFANLRVHESISERVFGNIEYLPFRDQTFDLITANMVVEHVENPAPLLREVHRVLRPGGVFLFHTPNFLGYATLLSAFLPDFTKVQLAKWLQGRASEDVFPTRYRMNTKRSVSQAAVQEHFDVQEVALVESSAQTVMLGPVVALELLWIRLLRARVLAGLRTNLIVKLRKKDISQVASLQFESAKEVPVGQG
ncbi:MAG TPA: class I SAM-dependent methyltransferase [Terriglobales bacterium]|nr:class I SAM-dependent methyltransferase [Terriglobales bacterium]